MFSQHNSFNAVSHRQWTWRRW